MLKFVTNGLGRSPHLIFVNGMYGSAKHYQIVILYELRNYLCSARFELKELFQQSNLLCYRNELVDLKFLLPKYIGQNDHKMSNNMSKSKWTGNKKL